MAYRNHRNAASRPSIYQTVNHLIVHAAANAQRAVNLILGSTFEEEETSENAVDAAASSIHAPQTL